ncbi:RhoGAP-domain-containing protein [Peniophora sp. CONT]|nr:RhoGAP-domain-containing protein [Peniophora sp. CONT]
MGNAQSSLPNVLQPPPSPGKSGANRLRNVFKNKGKQRAVTGPPAVAAEPAQRSPLGFVQEAPPPPPKSPRMMEAQQPQPEPAPVAVPTPAPAPVPAPATQPLPRQRPLEVDTGKSNLKEDWRRSDATMASHHTVRPRSGTVPRPVSMAESTSTVMAHRRLSALVAEAEFVLPDDDDAQARLNSLNGTRKRHSISLHFAASPSPTVATPPATSSAAAEGYIGTAQRDGSSSTAGSQIRGRLAAWTTASASGHGHPTTPPAITVDEHGGWAPQHQSGWVPQKLAREPTLVRHEPQPQQSSGMLGFGRRVVRALGMQMPGQGHDTPPSRSPTPERRGPRRTPNAPSGTWSVHTADSSLSSQSQGNSLGPVLRGPKAQSGLVFGRPLNDAVRDTALEHVRTAMNGEWPDAGPSAPLADRALPALVVRCVQHIMTWGLEEEGLFRISGRASHIARLRSEFDTGADFDLQACPPGELDPHAVASIFKAYLRELPEPILTKQLTPLFEAAMDAENETRRSIDTAASVASAPASMPTQMPMPRRRTLESGGCGLPSSPRPSAAAAAAAVNNTVNRPSPLSSSPASVTSFPRSPPPSSFPHSPPPSGPIPSLAQPALAIAPPSTALLRRFRALVARLPRAHRDLLRTVSSLIRATASRKETRMPLSNLTVVFCPSLGLSPSILRVLCEQEEIWVPLSQDEIEDMRREQQDIERAASDRHSSSDSDGDELEVPEPETPVPQTPADVRAMYAINAVPASTPGSQHTQDGDNASFALSSASSSSLATPNSNAASREELALHARRTPIHTSPSAPNLSLKRGVVPGMSIRSFSSKSSLASSNMKISGPLELTGVSSPTTSTAVSFPSPTPSLGPGSEAMQFPATVPGTMFPRTDPDEPEQAQERPFSRPLARAKRPSLTMLFGKRSLSSLRSSRIMSLSPLSPRTASQPLLQRSSDGAGTRDTVYGGSASEGVSRRASVLDMGLGSLSLSRRASVLSPRTSKSKEMEEVALERVESTPPVLELGPLETSPLRVPGMLSPVKDDFTRPSIEAAVPEVVRRTTPPIDTTTANEQQGNGKTEITPLGELPAPYNRLSLWEDESDAADGELDGEWASSVLLAADAGWLGAERT